MSSDILPLDRQRDDRMLCDSADLSESRSLPIIEVLEDLEGNEQVVCVILDRPWQDCRVVNDEAAFKLEVWLRDSVHYASADDRRALVRSKFKGRAQSAPLDEFAGDVAHHRYVLPAASVVLKPGSEPIELRLDQGPNRPERWRINNCRSA